jgi:hypothetical protein
VIPYSLEHLFSFRGSLAEPEAIGAVPEGFRINFYSAGGTVEGSRVRGRLRSRGGDWMLVRPDGVAMLDVRGTIELDNGALVFITYRGTIDLGPDGYEKFLRGELPAVAAIRVAPQLVTSHPDYLWLNRLHLLGIGEYRSDANAATYDIYSVV